MIESFVNEDLEPVIAVVVLLKKTLEELNWNICQGSLCGKALPS